MPDSLALSMLIFLSFCFDDSNLRVESEEADPVPREGLGKGRSDVLEDLKETRTSRSALCVSSWKMEGGVEG